MRFSRTMEGLQYSLSNHLSRSLKSSWRITMIWSCHQSRMSSTRKWTPINKRRIIDQEVLHTQARAAKDRSNQPRTRSGKSPWVSKVFPRALPMLWKTTRTALLSSLIRHQDSTLIWDHSNLDLRLVSRCQTPPRKNWTRRRTKRPSKNLLPNQTQRVAPTNRRRY